MTTQTIVANLRRAAFNRQTVEIGGGLFYRDELTEAARLLELAGAAVAALREAEVLLEASYLDHEGTDNGKAIFSGLEHVREVLGKLEGGEA